MGAARAAGNVVEDSANTASPILLPEFRLTAIRRLQVGYFQVVLGFVQQARPVNLCLCCVGRELCLVGPRAFFRTESPREDPPYESRFEDGVIETEWVVTDARGSNRYTVSEDGETLVVHHMIQITTLAGVEPIRYRSHFQRTPGVASGLTVAAD